jgi:hypothetical protein
MTLARYHFSNPRVPSDGNDPSSMPYESIVLPLN